MPISRVGDLDIAWDAEGDGDPVVMINGLGADRTAWYRQTPVLQREFRTITFDNRDVGETGAGSDPTSYGMRRLAADTVGLMDALGIERAHIVGASMGGAISQELAIAYPARVRTLTIVCSWARTDPFLAELLERWERVFAVLGPLEWARTSWLWVFTHRYYADPSRLNDLVAAAAAAPFPQNTEMYIRQSRAVRDHDALDRLGQITAPTHIICGEEDIFTPLHYSREIAESIPGARLSVIPNVGHGMFWEATDAFNELVMEFVRGEE